MDSPVDVRPYDVQVYQLAGFSKEASYNLAGLLQVSREIRATHTVCKEEKAI